MLKRKRQQNSTRMNRGPLTAKEIKDLAAKLPPDQPFFTPSVQGDNSTESPDTDIYRQMYNELHARFGKYSTSSSANSKKIQQITGSGLDSISPDIELWLQDPQGFWEGAAVALPRYGSLVKSERLAGFIKRAVSLESEAKKQQVQKSFVAVSAYKFFVKVDPNTRSKITHAATTKFLQEARLSEANITTAFLESCVAIIQRGQRCSAFCETLSPPNEGECVDYGPLFDPELPANLFDFRHSLSGKPRENAIEHLKKWWKPTCRKRAEETARILLKYNDDFCWIGSNEEQASSGSLPTSSLITLRQETSSSEQRQPDDTGRLHALAAAAEVSRPTTRQGPNPNGSDMSESLGSAVNISGITGADGVEGEIEETTDDAYGPGAPATSNNCAPITHTYFGDCSTTNQATQSWGVCNIGDLSMTQLFQENITGDFGLNDGSSSFNLYGDDWRPELLENWSYETEPHPAEVGP